MLELNYRDPRPMYEQIQERIRKLIVTGSVDSGEKLPSVRELASRLAINPNTIARAYRQLEEDGYVYSVSGKGTFVARQPDLLGKRAEELLDEFDELIKELLFLKVPKEDLIRRVEKAE